ncbi:hypothetical protein [Lactococcus lactis]|nr:hypothetical protein [Lactococcus lactis]
MIKQGKVGIKLVQKIMKQLGLYSVVIKKVKPGQAIKDQIKRKT